MNLLTLAFISVSSPSAPVLTVAGVLKAIPHYDNKPVAVRGQVASFVARGGNGHSYYLFKLTQGGQKLSVFGQGTLTPPPSNGSTVVVSGVFAHERHVGSRVYRDEIDSSPQPKHSYGVVVQPKK